MRKGNDGLLLLIERDLPHPVADTRRVVHHGIGVGVAITVGLGDVEHAICHLLQRVSLHVLEDGTVALVDVDEMNETRTVEDLFNYVKSLTE